MDEPVQEARPPAPWSTRVGAWLIDVLVVGAFVAVMGDVLGLGPEVGSTAGPVDLVQHGGVLFAYWTVFEATTGRSPGKLVLDLEVVDDAGTPPSWLAAAIESFGKAFLLPVDVLVGMVVMPGQRRRLFNRIAGTRVVSVDANRPRNRGASAVGA